MLLLGLLMMADGSYTFLVRLTPPLTRSLLLLLLLLLNQADLLLKGSWLPGLIDWGRCGHLWLSLFYHGLELLLDSPRREAETLKKLLLLLLEGSVPRALVHVLARIQLVGLLIGLPFLQDPPQPLAHVPEFEMCSSIRVRIFLPRIVVEVDTLVVDQILPTTAIGGSVGTLGSRGSFLPIVIFNLVLIHHLIVMLVIHLHDVKKPSRICHLLAGLSLPF